MSYALTIYPAEVRRAIEAGGEWEDVEDILLDPAECERILERLEKYGYRLTHERKGVREYEKDFGGQPVQVGVYDTEIAFSTPYWDGLAEALFDLRMDVLELADSPQLAAYDPQLDEWMGGGEQGT